ncbi:Tn3 family transposase [Azospirillum palustre]|uniref:Tn3 family transposase n=2 Tax=Azospirillum TaxID=191 RepID=A0A2B8BI96_9PROT|nr:MULTISPECIES: Tn3 family transposase [Azospirillum]KAA0585411.1 Tn3 family transposase [Azospirillum oryzae]PGH57253.1 Tn3 family transposase [Azospirillum palustre]QKS54566.1 Tn3 family transposase [Azospirillum oryzae]GLR77431.1 transposase [Azospirillum oryzae]
MPVSFLTPEQEGRYGQFPAEVSAEQLARFFHLDDADRVFILAHRGTHMRLGCAVQLGTVRFLGTFLEDPGKVPPGVIGFLGDQLGVPVNGALDAYRASQWRWRHPVEIRKRYGYRDFSDSAAQWRLQRWLYALCWTGTDRPTALFDQATAWLVTHKVLLPGASVLERTVARVRSRANSRLWRLLAARITPEQKARLDALLVVPEGGRQSPMDRLRSGPTLQSTNELVRAIERLDEVRHLVAGLPLTSHLPKVRIMSLARFAGVAKAQAVARLPDERRAATLLAFIRTLEASAQDDVLDLFDLLVTRMFVDAVRKGREARLRSLGDLDAAARILSRVCALVLDGDVGDSDLRTAVFGAVPQAALEAAVAQVDSLTKPPDDPYLDELMAQHRRIRRFLPHFVRVVGLGAMPTGRPVLKALHHLRTVGEGNARGAPWPTEFVPKSWERRVIRNGVLDRRAWTLCLVDRLRGALRRRDVFATPSLRFADPRIGLLDGAAWEAARPTVCRTLGKSQNAGEEIDQLTERLDQAFRTVTDNLPQNAGIRLERNGTDEDLVLTGLDRLDEPASLVALREAVTARLPRVDLPELLLEIDARTGFAGAFTHASEAEARAQDLPTTLCAMLLAEACNTGLEPLVRPDLPALRRSRLSWVRQNYLRAETLTLANARLVAAQNGIDLARRWGGGDVASADGLRFVVPVRTIHAGPNPKYFGSERGVTYYNLVSDQFTGLNAITVPGTLRDSLVLLSVVLEQETDLEPTEIMTDTGAYTDVIFGIFWLLGYQFSPRIADVGGARFWRTDPAADYGPLDKLAAHKVRTGLIAEHWDDLLRLAGSLKLGLVQAGGLMRTLQTNDRPTRLARALEELGRIIKTLYLLAYIDDEAYRRRILTQLNRGEGRHQLARVVFHGKRGELRQRYREGQEDQLGALGLVVNAIILWNTIYMDAALDQLRMEGFDVRNEDVARLSPLAHEHINMLGRYAFTLPEPVARGELRPLRSPVALAYEDA